MCLCVHVHVCDWITCAIHLKLTWHCKSTIILKILSKIKQNGSSHCSSVVTNSTSIHEDHVQFMASLSGFRIQHCHELWCRSQTWLRSCVGVVVVQAGSCSSDSAPILGTSTCHKCNPKKERNKNKWSYLKKHTKQILNGSSLTSITVKTLTAILALDFILYSILDISGVTEETILSGF